MSIGRLLGHLALQFALASRIFGAQTLVSECARGRLSSNLLLSRLWWLYFALFLAALAVAVLF